MTTLALVPPPRSGETLPSWVNRIAAANHLALGWALHSLTLTTSLSYRSRPVTYGHYLNPDTAANIISLTGIDTDTLHSMLTTSWIGTYAAGTGPNGEDWKTDARVFAQHNWVYLNGSHYCPQCLHETGGAWQLNWKLPWNFLCETHQTFLHSACPQCGSRADYGREDGSLAPQFPSYIPKPGHCHNPTRQQLPRKTKGPCWHNHQTDPPEDEAPTWLIDIQKQLSATTQSHAWWKDLRVLATYAITVQTVEQVEGLLGQTLPTALKDSWTARHSHRIQQLETARQEQRETGVDHRAAPKDTTARTPPQDPLLMATASAIALKCLHDDHALHTLLNAATADPTSTLPIPRLRALSPSPHLEQRAEQIYLGERASLRDHGLDSRKHQPSNQTLAWNAHHLPPLLWQDLYDQYIEPVAPPKVAERTLRRFSVIALYKARTGSTWSEATSHFTDDVLSNPRLAASILDRARQTPDGDIKLLGAITQLANALNDDARVKDYPTFRANLTHLLRRPIPDATYKAALKAQGRKRHTHADSTSLAAAAVWAELASDDRANAPIWGDEQPHRTRLDSVKRWRDEHLKDTFPALCTWATHQSHTVQAKRPCSETG